MSVSEKLISRFKKVIKGQKSAEKKTKKSQISNFIKNEQIICQNEALDVGFFKKVALKKVIKVQKSRKKDQKKL